MKRCKKAYRIVGSGTSWRIQVRFLFLWWTIPNMGPFGQNGPWPSAASAIQAFADNVRDRAWQRMGIERLWREQQGPHVVLRIPLAGARR